MTKSCEMEICKLAMTQVIDVLSAVRTDERNVVFKYLIQENEFPPISVSMAYAGVSSIRVPPSRTDSET